MGCMRHIFCGLVDANRTNCKLLNWNTKRAEDPVSQSCRRKNETPDGKDVHDQKDQEDGDIDTSAGTTKADAALKKYKLGHRHLTEMADVNTWSEKL